MSETLGKLIPLNSGFTTIDNTYNFDNEVDQSSDELLYMAAAETELILQDFTDITEIENRNQSSTIAL
jgi:hypothetical protein